jgi:hypothetical protein
MAVGPVSVSAPDGFANRSLVHFLQSHAFPHFGRNRDHYVRIFLLFPAYCGIFQDLIDYHIDDNDYAVIFFKARRGKEGSAK